MTFDELGILTSGKTGRHATKCPKCSKERKKVSAPCLTFNNEQGNRWFKCNHCNWSGNLEVMDKYNNVRKEAKVPDSIAIYPPEVIEWLQSKGISTKTAMNEIIYYRKSEAGITICFPYYISFTPVNVKFRNLHKDPKWYQLKTEIGTKHIFWGLNKIDLSLNKEVIITEGETDRLTWLECGYNNVISIPQGAPPVESKSFDKYFDFLSDNYFKSFDKHIESYIVATDNDEAGINLRELLCEKLGKERCKILKYPERYKDINEVLIGGTDKQALGKDGVHSVRNSAKPYPISGVILLNDIRDNVNFYMLRGNVKGMGINEYKLDSLFTVKSPYMYVVTGAWGMGKSTWLRWYLVELCRNNPGNRIAYFSPESRPIEREYSKLISCHARVDILENKYSLDQFKESERFIKENFFIISPTRDSVKDFGDKTDAKASSLKNLFKHFEYCKKNFCATGYVIDPWNTVDHQKNRNENDHDYLYRVLEDVHNFNQNNGMFGFIITHPTKEVERKASGNWKKPGLNNISGGSMWGNKADIGIIVSRNPFIDTKEKDDSGEPIFIYDDTKPTIITTDKIKFEELGRCGSVEMNMIKEEGMRFEMKDKYISSFTESGKEKAYEQPQDVSPF